MTTQYKLLKYCLPIMACWFLSQGTAAQSKQNDACHLPGKWILENVYIHETNDTVSIDLASIDEIEIYPQLDMTENELAFSYEGNILKRSYKVNDMFLYLSFYETEFYAEWMITDGKLHLSWEKDVALGSDDKTSLLLINLTYIRE